MSVSPADMGIVIPDQVEPIVSFRVWKLGSNGHLNPLAGGKGEWIPKKDGFVQEALCRGERSHPAPDKSCSCGYWSLKSLRLCCEYANDFDVIGEVYLWGRVLEGTHGYRAQYAYPKRVVAFGVPFFSYGPGQEIAEIYGCEAMTLKKDDFLSKLELGSSVGRTYSVDCG